jgi:hypothetical protein
VPLLSPEAWLPELYSTRTRKSWGDVVYRFKTRDGREIDGREKVGVGVWEATREGQTVRVQYLPGDAASNRVLDDSGGGIPTWIGISFMGFLGASIASLGGFLLFRSLQQFSLEVRLGREGVPAAATVAGVVQSGWRNRQALWVIRYRYTDDLGSTQEGRCEELSPEEAAGWKAGDAGTIRYDRRRPAASLWLGRSGGSDPMGG